MGTRGCHKGLQHPAHQPWGQPLQLAVAQEAVAADMAERNTTVDASGAAAEEGYSLRTQNDQSPPVSFSSEHQQAGRGNAFSHSSSPISQGCAYNPPGDFEKLQLLAGSVRNGTYDCTSNELAREAGAADPRTTTGVAAAWSSPTLWDRHCSV